MADQPPDRLAGRPAGQLSDQAAGTVLLGTHPGFLRHIAGPGHPERPSRLEAVMRGVSASGVAELVTMFEPGPACADDVARVHDLSYLERLRRLSEAGGGALDPDTAASAGSFEAAMLAAGSGPAALQRLRAGEAGAAFLAVRPPGHHATRSAAMGFCLLNNAAIAAARLAEEGERVMIVDIDAHHGNGTQDAFYEDPRVLYVSFHQWPLYPGTGRIGETGSGRGLGANVNLPMPPGATGDGYLGCFDEIVAPLASRFRPTWLVVSAGYDAHRDDPLTSLALTSGDYLGLLERCMSLAPAGRRLVFLEGGYDLGAIESCTAAVLSALAGRPHASEGPSSGGPGADVAGQWARANGAP
ncbi:MAG: histone deacetylase family protein [Acidimicrobiales bacterium]